LLKENLNDDLLKKGFFIEENITINNKLKVEYNFTSNII
jgi:hypothetical protein